jgi:hypothetical protein
MIRALWMVAAIHAASAAPTRQPGDDALMFAAAMADLLPPGQRLSGEEAASRPLFVGVAASEQAFGQARGRPVALDLAPVLDRPFAARTFEEVEVCAPPRGRGPECTIRDHGLWVDVRRVALSATVTPPRCGSRSSGRPEDPRARLDAGSRPSCTSRARSAAGGSCGVGRYAVS